MVLCGRSGAGGSRIEVFDETDEIGQFTDRGVDIGALILQATYNFDSALLYSAITMSAFLSGSFFLVIALLERVVVRWQPPQSH